MQEGLCIPLPFSLKEKTRHAFLAPRRERSYHQRQRIDSKVSLYLKKLSEITLIFHQFPPPHFPVTPPQFTGPHPNSVFLCLPMSPLLTALGSTVMQPPGLTASPRFPLLPMKPPCHIKILMPNKICTFFYFLLACYRLNL